MNRLKEYRFTFTEYSDRVVCGERALIRTSDGWKRMPDVRVGDYVIAKGRSSRIESMYTCDADGDKTKGMWVETKRL